jgi:pimeloyl-ACP methyl ester carboxylesterase
MDEVARHLRFTPAEGVDLALSVFDGADGEDARALPVLLLHGLSQQRAFWDPVLRRMRTRPVAVLDQRGHGASDTPLAADYSLGACAEDAVGVLALLGWDRAVVVGHSWGASVALAAAASAPERVAGAALIDGGLWSPAGLGPRAEVRERLTPPALGLPEEELWSLVRQGDLGPWWRDEVRAALAPTFVRDSDGLLRTRIGVERHLRVLDGLLDHDGRRDLDACEASGVPVWAALCDPLPGGAPATGLDAAWRTAREQAAQETALRANCRIHRWAGAVHDVPLQWPALVAGFVDALVEEREAQEP